MNWLFLRGRMVRHKECSWKTLEECTDMWTHLFSELVHKEDFGAILYSNGKRNVTYRSNFVEEWINKFSRFERSCWTPDVIVARGGFKEYVPLLKKYPKAKKVYYGANHGCIPEDNIKYDLILCDSSDQVEKCTRKGLRGELFFKPAAPQFKVLSLRKKYNAGFSAIWPNDQRKRVSWVHETAPRGMNILQMGHACKTSGGISVKYVDHKRMVKAINKCKVIILPYTKEDSCPRIISEALACGVPVVRLSGGCHYWKERYGGWVVNTNKSRFWKTVKHVGKTADPNAIREYYDKYLSLRIAGDYLRSSIFPSNG